MIEINLIPDVKQELLRAQRTRAMVISTSILVSIITGAVVVLLLLYVFGVQTVRSSILDGQIKDGYAELSQVEDLSKVLTIQNQLTKIDQLNSQKKMDSRAFDMLSASTPTGDNAVQFSQIIIDSEEGTISLEGQTRAYDSMEVFKKTLDSTVVLYNKDGEQEEVKLATDISTTNISYGENSNGNKVVRFTVTYAYPEELFSPEVTDVTFKFSVNGNVTDSYLGIPKSLFTERAKDL